MSTTYDAEHIHNLQSIVLLFESSLVDSYASLSRASIQETLRDIRTTLRECGVEVGSRL